MHIIKKLSYGLKNNSGRNNLGRISTYHVGGGHKQRYLLFKNIFDQKKKYIILSNNIYFSNKLTAGLSIVTSENGNLFYTKVPKISNNFRNLNYTKSPKNFGDFSEIKLFQKGNLVNNLEKFPKSGPVYIRAAGTRGICLSNLINDAILIKLPSGDLRFFNKNCMAFWGISNNESYKFIKLKKAGSNRWRNRRPIVRGVAMNPIDHPHGGGEGKTSGGRPSVSPWGRLTKGGFKTVKKKKNEVKV